MTSESKDVALRAIGRTVVNFQRLEHNLKLAARVGPLQGTLAKIDRDAQKRAKRAETLTLGQAIQAWLLAAQSEPIESGYTPDLFDVTFQVSLSLISDAERLRAHGAALQSLLETRNSLVHGRLVHIEWDSPDACARLVSELEVVNEAIRIQMEFVTAILSAVRELGAIREEDWERAVDGLTTKAGPEQG